VTIARSRSIDRLRSRGAAAQLAEADPSSSMSAAAPAPLEAAERRQDRERVAAALRALPSEQRHVLELSYFEGLSQSEIAARLGDPLGTVKTRVRLGMEKLAGLLAEPEGIR
jgi:RNA polymerase sigma-70 factor (ECF subfamily)